MTLANKISMVRILLAPVFVWQIVEYYQHGGDGHRYAALAAFALSSAGDAVDGYVARRFNQRTELGAILDPLADKVLITSALVVFTWEKLLPLWLLGTVVLRELIILAGMILVRGRAGKVKVTAHPTGKIATALTMTAVIWILLQLPQAVLPPLVLGAALATVLSAAFYILDGVRQFYSHPVK